VTAHFQPPILVLTLILLLLAGSALRSIRICEYESEYESNLTYVNFYRCFVYSVFEKLVFAPKGDSLGTCSLRGAITNIGILTLTQPYP